MEWSIIPVCPGLMCFFNRVIWGGGVFFKGFVFNVCVCFVLCKFVSGLILWFLDNLWFVDLRAEWIGDGLNIVFSHDKILCG